jgi:atypical dual specificity phosphatase
MLIRRLIARVLFFPTLAWNVLMARVLPARRWWDQIDAGVYLGALPLARDVPRWQALGVGAVVNMCEEYAGPEEAYRRAGIEQLRLPTVDFTAPSLEQVQRGVTFIAEQLARGRGVYVHCKAGRARSATVVLCWLVAARGMTPDAAQALILARRPHAHPQLARRAVVQQFCAALREAPRSPGVNP